MFRVVIVLLFAACVLRTSVVASPAVVFGLDLDACRVDVSTFQVCGNATACRQALCARQSAPAQQQACIRFTGNLTTTVQDTMHDPFPHAILFAIESKACHSIRTSGRECYDALGCYKTALLMQQSFLQAFVCQHSTDTRCFPPTL